MMQSSSAANLESRKNLLLPSVVSPCVAGTKKKKLQNVTQHRGDRKRTLAKSQCTRSKTQRTKRGDHKRIWAYPIGMIYAM